MFLPIRIAIYFAQQKLMNLRGEGSGEKDCINPLIFVIVGIPPVNLIFFSPFCKEFVKYWEES